MNITNVRVKKSEGNDEKLLGFADITLNNEIAIHGIKIIKGKDRNFISFPSTLKVNKETNESKFVDIVHPINTDTRTKIEEAIFAEYNKLAE